MPNANILWRYSVKIALRWVVLETAQLKHNIVTVKEDLQKEACRWCDSVAEVFDCSAWCSKPSATNADEWVAN